MPAIGGRSIDESERSEEWNSRERKRKREKGCKGTRWVQEKGKKRRGVRSRKG